MGLKNCMKKTKYTILNNTKILVLKSTNFTTSSLHAQARLKKCMFC